MPRVKKTAQCRVDALNIWFYLVEFGFAPADNFMVDFDSMCELIGRTPGIGTVGHLSWELFNHLAGTHLLHVPYKGSGQANNDFLAGQIDLRAFSTPSAIPLMKTGKAKVIAINGLKRSPLIPDVPTAHESGLPGFESANWNGIMAPAGTPREIVTKLYDEILRRVVKSDLREQLIKDGYEVVGLGPEDMTVFMQKEVAKWAKVIKIANVKVD